MTIMIILFNCSKPLACHFQGKNSVHFRISVYGWKIRNSVLFVAVTNVIVPAFYHSMVVKQKPSFRHGTHYLFKSSRPDKGLLCHWCVQAWKRFLQVVAGVFDLAFRVFVVFHMQAIHNFSHFEPHQIIRLGKGQWFLSYGSLSRLHILSQAAITSSHLLSSMPSSRLRRY